MIKILLLTDYSQESERRFLNGFVKYADTQGGCVFYPMSHLVNENVDNSMEIIKFAKTFKVDAILGLWHNINEVEAKKLNIPIFLRTYRKVYPDFPMLTGNYKEFGAYAGKFFTNRSFEHFAFIGMKGILWSMSRCEGYSEYLRGFNKKIFEYQVTDFQAELKEIAAWLHALPKPTALFACNDFMARKVTELCLVENIRIPDDISLLGVDNDEFMCNISFPTISSIRLNFEKQGYELAEILFQMVNGEKVWPARMAVEAVSVVERMSTKRKIIANPYIRDIVEFIEKNYKNEIDVRKLVSFIPLSRRAIEIKFKKEMFPYTIKSFIAKLRLDHFCHLLETTDLPIRNIAEKSGFIDSTNYSALFKKYNGLTPSEYRRSFK